MHDYSHLTAVDSETMVRSSGHEKTTGIVQVCEKNGLAQRKPYRYYVNTKNKPLHADSGHRFVCDVCVNVITPKKSVDIFYGETELSSVPIRFVSCYVLTVRTGSHMQRPVVSIEPGTLSLSLENIHFTRKF